MTSYTSGETQLEVKIYLYLNVSCYEFKRIDYGLYENNEIYKIQYRADVSLFFYEFN